MKKKLVVGIGIVLTLLICSYPVFAIVLDPVNNVADQNRPSIIIEYGKGKEAGLVKVTHIHYVKSEAKGRPPKTETCYKLAGWKWTTPVTYTINPENSQGLSQKFIVDAIKSADFEWDTATSMELFTVPDVSKYPYVWSEYDGTNSISFGDYPSSNVIAVTVTWYTRGTREAIDSDILFDTDFAWGDATTDPSLMDLQNIATHEIGHTLGLSDLYGRSCSSVTMYGYSTEGDVEKRTLEPSDITGLRILYGS